MRTIAPSMAPEVESPAAPVRTPAASDPGSTGGLLDAIDAGHIEPSAQLSPVLQRIADGFEAHGARP